MFGREIILNKVAGGGAGCTDIVDNYDPFDGGGLALYQLNGDAEDSSPNNYTLTDVNSNVTLNYASGVFGQSLYPTTTSDNARLENTSIPNYLSQSFWIKLNSFSVDDDRIFSYSIRKQGTTHPEIITTNGDVLLSTSDNLPTGVWTHVVVVIDGTNLVVYYNGKFQTNKTVVIGTALPYQRLMFISDQMSTPRFEIDQARLFTVPLTPLEVEALYTEELCICDGTVDTLDILGDGSCIATYPLDGNANDLSGNYSGTPTDVSYGVGEFDLAGVFNGSSSYISGMPSISNAGGQSASVSIWFKKDSTPSSEEFLFGAIQEGGQDDPLFLISLNTSGNLVYGYRDTYQNEIFITDSSNYCDGNWHNVVATIDSSNMRLYVDGSESSSSPNTNFSGTMTLDISVIGARNLRGTIQLFYDGLIDQVRIFDKALNSTEVTTLYNETACTKGACSGTTNTLDILSDGSCIAAYPLDGSPLDLSGNYNGVQTDITYPVGYFDLAGSFNGSTSYIDNLPTITNIASSFSVSLWFKSSVTPSKTEFFIGAIANQGAGTNKDSLFLIQINSSEDLSLYVRGTDEVIRQIDAAGSYSDGNWHHVVATVSTTTAALYVDDNLINTANADDTITVNNLVIGARDNRGTIQNFFTGQIDQVRIFNKVLSAGDVTTLNNETPCN